MKQQKDINLEDIPWDNYGSKKDKNAFFYFHLIISKNIKREIIIIQFIALLLKLRDSDAVIQKFTLEEH